MKKSTLYLLLIGLLVSALYLGFRLHVQSAEFETSRETVERQTEELIVLIELLNISELKLDDVRTFLNEKYPNEDLGPYSQQIQWRDMNFYFPRDSTIFAISYTTTDWACGTLFGCVSSAPNYLTSYTSTIFGYYLAFGASYLAYPILILLFVLALWRVYKFRDVETLQFKTSCFRWGYTLLAVTIFIALGFATIWWDLALNTGASPALLYAGWSELWYRVGLGFLFSIVLMIIGLYGESFLTKNKNITAAL